MLEKGLIKKLNNLRNIKPDNQWKNNYREILFSQISAGQTNNLVKPKIFNLSKSFYQKLFSQGIFIELTKPLWVTIILITIFTSGSVASIYASRDAKPGDSLYLAKLISEKAKLAITFNERAKAKLNLEYASNRAQEMSQIVNQVKTNEQDRGQVEQLAKSFKNEITEVKSRLSKINIKNINQNEARTSLSKGPDNITTPPIAEQTNQEVFGANLEKNNQRMEISEPKKDGTKTTDQATSTPPIEQKNLTSTSTTDITAINNSSPDKILDEAEKLFNEKNYSGTIDKLEEVNTIIDQATGAVTNQGEVKGIEETSTTTTSQGE